MASVPQSHISIKAIPRQEEASMATIHEKSGTNIKRLRKQKRLSRMRELLIEVKDEQGTSLPKQQGRLCLPTRMP